MREGILETEGGEKDVVKPKQGRTILFIDISLTKGSTWAQPGWGEAIKT